MYKRQAYGPLCLGLGTPVADRMQIRVSFQQALSALEHGIKQGRELMFYLDLFSDTSFFRDYPFRQILELGRGVLEDNEQRAVNAMTSLRQNIQMHSGESIYVKTVIHDCADTVFKAFLDKNFDVLLISETMLIVSQASSCLLYTSNTINV